MAADKDTVYIDVDDEITGIIDKVKASKSKVVALVLPKRASVFQSIVNMKLLKKAADSTSKNVVLITSEAGLMPLAGAAGIHVAKTLTSKPEIPAAPIPFKDGNEAYDEDTEVHEELDQSKSIGELSGAEAAAAGVEMVALDNTEPAKEEAEDKAIAKPKKDKKLKVPNFERFRKYLLIAAAVLILLIIFIILGTSAFAKATIHISTNGTNVNTNLNLNLSTTATSVDPSNGTIPAKQDQEQKTFSQQVGTTGQKNNGNKASGSVSLSATVCKNPNPFNAPTLPTGSGLSNNNQTYITQSDTQFTVSGAHLNSQGCDVYPSSNSTSISAQSGGSGFNVSGVAFAGSFHDASVGDYSVSGTGSASGGSDNIVQVVSQGDINNAKSKISSNDSSVKSDLNTLLKGQNYYPITATYNAGNPTVTSSSNVGDQASNVTVTETIIYTMFGVHKSDLKALVDQSVDGQIDTSKQSVLNEGLDQANFNVNSLNSSGGQLTMSTVAEAGPHIDVDKIKQSIAGLRAGDIKSQLNTYPGVTNVTVKFSPFWRSNAPKNTAKINVIIDKPKTTKSNS